MSYQYSLFMILNICVYIYIYICMIGDATYSLFVKTSLLQSCSSLF